MTKEKDPLKEKTQADTPAAKPAKRPVGRPRKDGAFRVNVQARVSEETAEACQKLGGTPFIRQLLMTAAENYRQQLELNKRMQKIEMDAIMDDVERFIQPHVDKVMTPYFNHSASCGFPSPAGEGEGEPFSFHDFFVRHPKDTFIMNARGDSMTAAGIFEDDIIVIDRSLEARNGDIVLAFLNGDMTLKRLHVEDGKPELHPESLSSEYPVLKPTEYDDFQIIGVLTGTGRRYR